MPKYEYFIYYHWNSNLGGTGENNCSMVFQSPITTMEQIIDAQKQILAIQPRFNEIVIRYWIFLQEIPTEGNHESGPEEQQEDDITGPAGAGQGGSFSRRRS